MACGVRRSQERRPPCCNSTPVIYANVGCNPRECGIVKRLSQASGPRGPNILYGGPLTGQFRGSRRGLPRAVYSFLTTPSCPNWVMHGILFHCQGLAAAVSRQANIRSLEELFDFVQV